MSSATGPSSKVTAVDAAQVTALAARAAQLNAELGDPTDIR